MPEQEQLTEVRGFAAQEVDEVEASTLEKLEGLKQEYEVEVEQLGSDLVVGPFFHLRPRLSTLYPIFECFPVVFRFGPPRIRFSSVRFSF